MVSSYLIQPGETQASIDARRRMALALAQQSAQPQDIKHWTQGLAQLANAGISGYELYNLDKQDREEAAKGNELMARMLSGGAVSQPSAPPPMPTPSRPAPSVSGPVASADPAPVTGPRPGGPVMPSNKVWGDAEAEAAGLYETPAKNVKMASALAAPTAAPVAPMPPGPQVAQAAPPPASASPAGPNRELLVQMLANRKTAPIAQQIISAQIGQQFKPSEYDFKERPDGTLVAVNKKNPRDVHVVNAPGGGQSAIDFEAKKAGAIARSKLESERAVTKPEQDKQQQDVAKVVTADIDRAIKKVDSAFLPTTGMTGSMLSKVGGTAANDVRALVDTVKANTGFQELQKMRNSSPTGGALGSITERELALLQSTVGNLEQSQTADQFKDNLRRVKNVYLDIIHGEGKGPSREKLTYQEQSRPDRAAIEQEMKRRGLR